MLCVGIVACTDREAMQERLAYVSACNRADTVFSARWVPTVDSLVEFFDRHGSPNDRMMAHYLQGRVHHDLGEAPRAIDCYQEAVDCADTTSRDCDYSTLCRVHAQLGDLFYWQQQYQRQQEELRKSYQYALLGGDTVLALYNCIMRGTVYSDLHQNDSAIVVLEDAMLQCKQAGYDNYAAICSGGLIEPLLGKGKVQEARQYINLFESESGVFDEQGNIEPGRESFYYVKSLYFQYVHQYDSAEYYLRKLQQDTVSLNNMICAANGLSLLYEKRGVADSLAKYARLSSSLQDSMVAQIEHDNILRFDKMYQYERLQAKVNRKTQEAMRAEFTAWGVFGLLVLLSLLFVYFYREWQHKKKQAWEQYIKDQEEMERLQETIDSLEIEKSSFESTLDENRCLIADVQVMQTEMEQLKERIDCYEQKHAPKKRILQEKRLNETQVVKKLKEVVLHHKLTTTTSDWTELQHAFDQFVPNFYLAFHNGSNPIEDTEYVICMLIWLNFSPSDISDLIAMSKAYVSVTRKRLLKDIFNIEGSTKEFDALVRNIC